MEYLLFGAFIFWALFFCTPIEGLVVALILFAINCIKLIRIVGELDRSDKLK